MCTVSSDIKLLNITIHNQYPGLELTSPVYFSTGTIYHVSSSQQVSTDNTVKASFGIDSKQKYRECALLYKLQRKHVTEPGNQPNNSTAFIEYTITNMYLLAVCDVKNNNHEFYVCLLEFTDDFAWDEDKLWALYKEYNDQFF
jgi:hypothetical protein